MAFAHARVRVIAAVNRLSTGEQSTYVFEHFTDEDFDAANYSFNLATDSEHDHLYPCLIVTCHDLIYYMHATSYTQW